MSVQFSCLPKRRTAEIESGKLSELLIVLIELVLSKYAVVLQQSSRLSMLFVQLNFI